jgi:hypothetical protein
MDGPKANLLQNLSSIGQTRGSSIYINYWKAAKALVDSLQHPEVPAALISSIERSVVTDQINHARSAPPPHG